MGRCGSWIFVAFLVAAIAAFVTFLSQRPVDYDLYSIKREDLPTELQDWYSRGRMVEVNSFQMYVQVVDPDAKSCQGQVANEALILVHGFPTSSFDYHRAIDHLQESVGCRSIVMFDHVGFGFSEKPMPEVRCDRDESILRK